MREYEELRKKRQLWGNKEYGDLDIDRDKIKDAIEEVLDTKNILSNRLFYQLLKKFGYISQEVIEEVTATMEFADELIVSIKKLENILEDEYGSKYVNGIQCEMITRIGDSDV